jgi:WD40 repeat protein
MQRSLKRNIYSPDIAARQGVAYSPDGLNLVTASSDGTIKLWDTRSGQELRTLRGHQSDVTDVAFSPDGRIVASASADGTARLWDAATGEVIKVLEGHTSIVLAVAFSPDGARLATASQDGTARVWDVASGEWLYTLAGHKGAVNDIAYSPDGEHLATTDRDRIRVWDASDGGLGELAVLPWGCEITSSNLSQDGTLFIQGCEDGRVILRDATSLQELSTFEPTMQFGAVAGVALSPDVSRLAAAQGLTIRVWDLASSQVQMSLSVPTGDVGSLAFSPDGGLLAAGIGESDILIWDAASGKEQYSLSSHSDKWENWWSYPILPGKPIFPSDTQTGRPGKVVGLVFSPDGTHLASIDTQIGIARVWEMPGGGGCMMSWRHYSLPVGCLQPGWISTATVVLKRTGSGMSRTANESGLCQRRSPRGSTQREAAVSGITSACWAHPSMPARSNQPPTVRIANSWRQPFPRAR